MALSTPFYVISDTHWYHDAIVGYCDRPNDFEVMMQKRWARTIKDSHTILHLGDLFFGGRDAFETFKHEVAPKLPGQKYLILGNHDKRKWPYEELGFTVIKPFSMIYRGYQVSFDHYPKLLNPDKDRKRVHIHGHIHSHGYARGEATRFGNVNVSVEVLDYRPHRVTRLLNREILTRNGSKQRYSNSRHYRWHKTNRQKRAA